MDGKNTVKQVTEHMYQVLESEAKKKGFIQTEKALPFARDCHEGQFRDMDGGPVPYITHPMMVACHLLALGFSEDDLLAAAVLHDVCEDCGVTVDELPVEEHVRGTVGLLTFFQGNGETRAEAKARYFRMISESRDAVLIKLVDRCHNLSTMVYGFCPERMKRYIRETEEYIFPFLDLAERQYPELCDAVFLLRYQMESILGCVKKWL